MAKSNSTVNLKTKTSRGPKKLAPYREPYWAKLPAELIKGASLGFRRSPETNAETWHVRVFFEGQYHQENLGPVRPILNIVKHSRPR